MADLNRRALEDAVGAWAPEVRFFEKTSSTNTIASEWAREGAAEGCIVIADHQTAGRGRMDRTWFSRPGAGLLFSVILRPKLTMDYLGLVNLVAATAMRRALSERSIDSRVKWPNDLLISGKKVCGMLSETVNEPDLAVILGIGVNVNFASSEMPEEIREIATSISEVVGHESSRVDLLVEFLGAFGPRYAGLNSSRTEEVLADYREHCETIGREVRVETGTETIESRAVDVSPTGALILESGDVIRAGDVIHVR